MNSSRCGPTRGRAPATSEIEVRPDILLVRPTRANSKHQARIDPFLSPRVDGATELLSWSLKDGSAGSTPAPHKERAHLCASVPKPLYPLSDRIACYDYRHACFAPIRDKNSQEQFVSLDIAHAVATRYGNCGYFRWVTHCRSIVLRTSVVAMKNFEVPRGPRPPHAPRPKGDTTNGTP